MYRVTCSIRNARGREIAHRTPLWSGPADDPKSAIGMAHDALAPIISATAEADTIILHVFGPKDLRVTATEYAEDFRIGYGASAVGGTGLLADQIDTGLTAAQQLDAMRALKERAIKAMPGLAPKTLDADSSTGLERCKNKFDELEYLDSAQPTGELDRIMRDFGTEVEDAIEEEHQRRRKEALHIAAAYREEINRREFKILHDEWARMKADYLAVGGMGKMFLVQPDGSQKYIGGVQEFKMEVTP